jgi:hypothetical protein
VDWRYNTIWFEQIPKEQTAVVNFNESKTARPDLSGVNYFFGRSFKSASANFEDFPASDSLNYVHLTLSNVTSFSGIHRARNLKRLELMHCYKLETDAGLGLLSGSLEWLHVDQSKKFTCGNELSKLTNLRVLCLNDCAPIPSLDFLELFPKLLDFRFVNTKVEDGNLEPILAHPSLCSVGFLNKRHYSHKDSEIDRLLKPKKAAAIELAHKGRFETYRYLSLGT